MKLLMVMRHAKSSWADETLSDHDRPLNKRGRRDAPRIGKLLVERQLQPEITLCSTAVRARMTAKRVIQAFSGEPVLMTDRRLYHPSPRGFKQVLGEHLDGESRVLVISHNPGCEEFIYRLTGDFETLPTAAVALIELDNDVAWDALGKARAQLRDVLRPKEIF